MTVAENKEKILVINQDEEERSILVEAALEPFGYQVQVADSGGEGLRLIQSSPPDILILDLHVEDLSGRDIMAALNAQGIDLPVILLANHGAEKEALQAFRLGAKDYVVRPIREAEMIQVIERALKEVRLRRDREQATRQAQNYLAGLSTLRSIGKSITGLRSLTQIFEQVIQAAKNLSKADASGFFLRDDQSNELILRAGQNLGPELNEKMGEAIDDDLAALVMSSRETFIASGEGLKRFKPAFEKAGSVIYAPLVVQDAAIGLLWVANYDRHFEEHMKDLMTSLADYAAIAVVNARLFATMHERQRQLEEEAQQAQPEDQETALQSSESVRKLIDRMRGPLTSLLGNMNMFRTGQMGRLLSSHQAAVDVMYRQLNEMITMIDETFPPDTGGL